MLADAQRMRITILVTVGLALVGGVVLAVAVARAIVKPVQKLAEAAGQMAPGTWGSANCR